jgi:hypothetical protein
MTKGTRYFMFGSVGLLIIGLTVGLAAYYGGIRGLARQSGPGELALVPSDAAVVAYANVRELMASQFRQQMKDLGASEQQQGQNELRNTVGIDVEKDIDYVVGCLLAGASGPGNEGRSGYVVARGRFDEPRIEAFIRSKGGVEEQYKGRRLFVRPVTGSGETPARNDHPLAMTFVEPGVVALGTVEALHKAIDVSTGTTPAVTANREMMKMIGGVESGNAWVVGRFDALTSEAHLPAEVQRQLPQLTWFSASGHVNGGVSGSLSVQARDQEAATNLEQVVGGFIALAKMQAGSRPELNALLQSITLSGNAGDNTVSVSFSVPPAALEALKAAASKKAVAK